MAAVLLLGTAACAVLNALIPEGPPKRPFSHKIHGPEQELECAACHGKAETGAEAGMPASLKRCMMCHEGIDEKKPPERQLTMLVGEKPEWSRVTDLPEEITFSHKTHVDAKIGCGECHRGIETNESVTKDVRVEKDDCMGCHARRGESNECATCHKEIRKETPPATHHRNWEQIHGLVVRSGENPPVENRCSLCHTQAHCTNCHQDQPPRNHTNFWRIQGHSIAVGVDRSSCATCHRSDFCDRCHAETAPRSHRGAWGGPRNQHCLGCHNSPGSQGCALCHKGGAPSHVLASPRPTWHVSGMNCRQCHGPGLVPPMPHVDNGDNCSGCHP
ncbi:MAG: cytochrome c3 family protein [Planctomycetes bacterium]|nr:cytochrome c3 family protein [Planctomycetota bacterium]